MYHIPDDKRAKHSADLLAEAMTECLKHKDFDKVSISDLNKICFVSRSTFYRLFDNTSDILKYMCDTMFETVLEHIGQTRFDNPVDMMATLNREIMSKSTVITALERSGRTDILYNTQIKYSPLFIRYFNTLDSELSPVELDCIIRILTSSLFAYIGLWVEKGRHETPEELTAMVMKSFRIIAQITIE